ncbi:MAG: glutamine synthetase [Planctomycetes bacterium]|nr:glutamine synthetase [Planctomycetota bacterium]
MTEPYALSNPLSRIVDKPPADYTRADLLRILETRQLKCLTFHYTALDGKLKELKIPVTTRGQAERVLAEGERLDGSSLYRGIVDAAGSDLYVVPLYRTAFLNPFDGESLDFLCRYFTRDGEVAPFTVDTILDRASALLKRTTPHELYALGELEFFLLSSAESKLYPAQSQAGYHATAPFAKSGAILDEMARLIAQLTGSVKYSHGEVGHVESVHSDLDEIRGKRAEQMEIEFLPTPIEDTADILVLSRWVIRNVAYRHGCVATFTPKLEEGAAGNGLHVHVELRQNGRNVMSDSRGELSEAARRLIGGLCHFADSLTAFGNTTSSAYLRLVPHQEAPTHICWSDANRSALVRVPLAWGKVKNLAQRLNPQQQEPFETAAGQQTVEIRSPDGSALVHLLLAGIAMAAQWGLAHEESLAVAENLYAPGNIFKDARLLERLPVLASSCDQSARIFLEKRALYEHEGVFPPGAIDYVAALLHAEDDLRMNERLAALPIAERVVETRRIMHKDLHRH